MHFDLLHALQRFPLQDDAAAKVAGMFRSLHEDAEDPYRRERAQGHFTASALVVSADGARTLLTHHRKLDRWLQPGGHADGDRDLARVALREVEEETGLVGVRLESGIFDLDRHWIPERPNEPGHWHYDVRFLVHAGDDERFEVSAESHELAWWPVADVATHERFDPSLRRMARRWLARRNDA